MRGISDETSKETLKEILEEYNREKQWYYPKKFLQEFKCIYANLVNPVMKKHGYIDEDGYYVNPVNYETFLQQLKDYSSELRKMRKLRKQKIKQHELDFREKHNLNKAQFVLFTILKKYNDSKKWTLSVSDLTKMKCFYSTSVIPCMIHHGYCDDNYNFLNPVDIRLFLKQLPEYYKTRHRKKSDDFNSHESKINSDSITLNSGKSFEFIDIKDNELVEELRKRGFDVSCKKTIEL